MKKIFFCCVLVFSVLNKGIVTSDQLSLESHHSDNVQLPPDVVKLRQELNQNSDSKKKLEDLFSRNPDIFDDFSNLFEEDSSRETTDEVYPYEEELVNSFSPFEDHFESTTNQTRIDDEEYYDYDEDYELVEEGSQSVPELYEVSDNGTLIEGPIAEPLRRRIRKRPGNRRNYRRKRPGKQRYNSLERNELFSGKPLDCDYYTKDICVNVRRYPSKEIVTSLGKNRRSSSKLLADVLDQSADNLIDGVSAAQEKSYTISHYYGSNRRQDTGSPTAQRDFAPDEIEYARPKRGRTATGVWKDIVNVADYTQTLRMEKCLQPLGSCTYVSHHYKSQCSQIYNYHRLLSWTKSRGLHMDIYKVPTCCSCHIKGYSYVYPPLKSLKTPSSSTSSSKPKRPFKDLENLIGEKFTIPFQRANRGPGNVPLSSPNEKVEQSRPVVRKRPQTRRPSITPPRTFKRVFSESLPVTTPSSPLKTRIKPSTNNKAKNFVARKRIKSPPPSSSSYQKFSIRSSSESDLPPSTNRRVSLKERHRHGGNREENGALRSVNYGYHPIIDFFEKYRFGSPVRGRSEEES